MPGWADDLLLRVGSLLWGFPSVRDSVLQALDAKSYERSNLPAELSVKLLANNGTFPGVANAFANWLREYTHYHLDWAIWRRLGEMFEGNSEVHEAAKRRLFDDTLAGRCKAWIIIGGEEGKEALLRALDSSLWGAPQLPASLLIEFWGQDDTEIATAIVKKACKGTQEAASLAHLLPQLMPREDCKRILIECLREAKPGLPCSNLVRAIEAVGALDEESVVEQMIRLGECDIGEYRGAPLEALLRSHPDDPRVSRLVCAEMARHRPSLGVVARGYGRENVERVKETLLRNAAPLPEVFRSQIVDFLDVYMSSTSHAYDLLRKLTEDANEAVSTAATVAVCRYLKGGDPADVEVEQRRLKEIALSYGMTYMARRRMAVAGLSALDRLSCLRGETERGEWYEEPTVWRVECPFPHECGNRFSRQILENWGSIQDALGTDSWNTHLVHVERLWRDFAPAALTSSNGGRKLAETMLSEVALSETPSGLLKFIAKTRPRSRRLMQRCLGILTASGSTRITTHQVAVAAQLIGSHFRGERSVLEVLRNEILTKGASGGLLAALASGWPMSDLAQQYFLQLRKGAYRLSEYNIWILRAAALHADELLERLIQYLRSRPQPWTSAGIAGPVVRRLRWDSDLEFLMQKRLEEEMTASEVTTFVRLLSTSTGAYGRLYEWCRRYLRRETKDVGYDLIAGRYRSTRRAVLDAVANEGY
jgi:hypothetical protein